VLLPPELASGRLARTFVDDNWCPVHGGDNHQLAHLLASELVTNAVRYGGPPITLTMECRGREGVLLSVSDGSNDLPERMDVGPQALGGRGVRLVDLLSADWGVEHHHVNGAHAQAESAAGTGLTEGKTVWCRLLT